MWQVEAEGVSPLSGEAGAPLSGGHSGESRGHNHVTPMCNPLPNMAGGHSGESRGHNQHTARSPALPPSLQTGRAKKRALGSSARGGVGAADPPADAAAAMGEDPEAEYAPR